ncbi:hypothetical protein ZIOFF_043588 [Zingiber officinale]|uniref:Uncharacterized protein n=1 Tax=Zingiber officinale TaxID=94328 RepID=A0A8J5KZN2_ZINOF|nr:hypothetical protein ZIOFF_043588 [Zingiber officinale]
MQCFAPNTISYANSSLCGTEVYPFTVKKISKLREEVENAKKDQTLRSILVSSSRDYLITNDRSKVSVSNLEGKIVALYISCNRDCCTKFNELIKEYEFEAWETFPFSQEKLHELSEKVKARLESQTLESLLVSDDLDYVIGKMD